MPTFHRQLFWNIYLLSISLSLWLSICVYAYAGKKGSTLSHGPRARGLKLDPEWPTLPIETSLQFSHWDPVTLPKILRHLNESLLNWQRTVQEIFNKTTVHRQVKSGLRVKRCLKLCFHMLNIKTSSSRVSRCRACKMCSGGARPIVNNHLLCTHKINLKWTALHKCENKNTYYLIINLNFTCSYVKLYLQLHLSPE